jgi:hypothetical protein
MQQETVDKGSIVAEIVRTRGPMIQRVAEQRTNLLKLGQALRALENLQAQIQQSGSGKLLERIEEVNIQPLQSSIQEELATLARLQTRFERKTLNIGVIGRARQGKSRLLQSLSGLQNKEIPTGDLGACTGVRSTILHNSQKSYGQVFYYTEREFLDDVLRLYYDDLQLKPMPNSVNQFVMNALPSLPEHLKGYQASDAKYERLKLYKKYVGAYRDLIGRPVEQVALTQVSNYVAQLTEDGKDLYNHYAVKEVKIYCAFPHAHEVEQVAFIDLPGLGDTSMGDEERLIKALGEDLDIALVVRKPVAGGDLRQADTDLSFYDAAQKPLKDVLPFHQWAFLILNRTQDPVRGDNIRNCEYLKAFIHASHTNKAFVDSMIVDCSQPNEVNTHVLAPVLKYLLQNINRLDEQYVRACQDGIANLHAKTTIELKKSREAFGETSLDDTDYELFQQLFDDTWRQLMSSLAVLLKTLEQKSSVPDAEFVKYFEGRFETCKNNPGIPSIKEIKEQRDVEDGYRKVYYAVLSEMRVHLTWNFINLDSALEKSMRGVKDEVAKVFLQLGHLSALPEMSAETFFQRMSDYMSESTNQKRLRFIFKVFNEYKLSYRGFFQQRIRQHLSKLKPDWTTIEPSLKPGMSDDEAAQAVFEALMQAHTEIVESVRTELLQYVKEPNQAAFAIVEEFIDQAMRAKGAIKEWNRFYRTVRTQVWESDFKNFVEWEHWQKNWANLVFKAQDANAFVLLK